MDNDTILVKLQQLLHERKNADPSRSYVASLYDKGTPEIVNKIIEEAAEVAEAANASDKAQIVFEISDLLFHCLVLLSDKNIAFADVENELQRRFGISGLVEKASR